MRHYRLRQTNQSDFGRMALMVGVDTKVEAHLTGDDPTTYYPTDIKLHRLKKYSLKKYKAGDIVVKVVGRFVEKPPTKTAKPFEIGKTYKVNALEGEVQFRIIASDADGNLVGRREDVKATVLFGKDGTNLDVKYAPKLVPEYEEVSGGLVYEQVEE